MYIPVLSLPIACLHSPGGLQCLSVRWTDGEHVGSVGRYTDVLVTLKQVT